MAYMDMEERGFVIGPLDADQLLRHMRITLNQQIHFRTSFEQAQLYFCGKRIGSWCGSKFLAVHVMIRAMFLCLNFVLAGSKAMAGFCNKM